jgi:hypothetical protein
VTRDELEIGKAMEPGLPITTWGERLDTIMRAADLYAVTFEATRVPDDKEPEPC